MNAARPACLAPECPACHRRALLDGACVKCGYNTDAPRPCGCEGTYECSECEEMTQCACGEEMPVSVAVVNDGLCRHCMGIEMAQDAAIERALDEARDQ